MTIDSLLDAIESVEFIGQLGPVSGFYAFDRALGRIPQTKELFVAMRDPKVAARVKVRVQQLLAIILSNQGAAYWLDLPLAAYLRLLDVAGQSQVQPLDHEVLRERGMWWSQRVSARVLRGERSTDLKERMVVAVTREPYAERNASVGDWRVIERIYAPPEGVATDVKSHFVASGARTKALKLMASKTEMSIASSAGGVQ